LISSVSSWYYTRRSAGADRSPPNHPVTDLERMLTGLPKVQFQHPELGMVELRNSPALSFYPCDATNARHLGLPWLSIGSPKLRARASGARDVSRAGRVLQRPKRAVFAHRQLRSEKSTRLQIGLQLQPHPVTRPNPAAVKDKSGGAAQQKESGHPICWSGLSSEP
jgi:hypothetical protein